MHFETFKLEKISCAMCDINVTQNMFFLNINYVSISQIKLETAHKLCANSNE